jgi:hypothetical protein
MTETTTTEAETATKMLERVRKLLAKAEAEGVTPQEADALTAKAAELMARYGIDKRMAEARANHSPKPGSRIFDLDNPWAQVKAHLLAGIAGGLGCQCVLVNVNAASKRQGIYAKVHVFGYQDDIAQIDMLYTSVVLQMFSGLRHIDVPVWLGGRQLMAHRRSWLLGYTSAVIGRVRTAYAKAVQEAEVDAKAEGTSTAVVLASRELLIEQAKAEAYPVLRKTRITYSGRGYSQGHAAGQQANIHDRPTVTGGSRALAR